MRSCYAAVACLLLLLPSESAYAQQLRRTTYVSGLTQPVAFIQDPADSTVQFVVQQQGVIRAVRSGVLLATPFLDLRTSISSGGERGLLGMAFPPNAVATGRVFVYFTDPSGDIVVARFKRSATDPLVADPVSRFDLQWSTNERVIRHPTFGNHNGGTLQFGPDGHLYVGVGDGGSGNDPNHNAQNLGRLLGKLLRIDVSVPDSNTKGFAVPPDNPFPSSGAPEIWDIGLRNPWKFSFDDVSRGGTGALVIGDVGQGAWEEVDYEPPSRGGNNYGWRNREGAHDNVTSLPPAFTPLVDPIFEYPHPTGFSITGGYVYRGTSLGTAFRGRYFFADFVAGKIWSIALTVSPTTGFATASDLREHTADLTPGNVSSFGVDASGELYFLDYTNGAVVRILPAAPPAQAPAMALDLPANFQTLAEPFALAGWAVDPQAPSGAGIDAIHVWAVPIAALGANPIGAPMFVGATSLTADRPDVAALFGSPQFTRCGFEVAVLGLPQGVYRLYVFALVTRTGNFDLARTVDVALISRPLISVDTPARGATVATPFAIAGWAIDTIAPSGTGIDTVHVWAAPISSPGPPVFLGATTTFFDRPDVGAIFGARFTRSGYGIIASLPAPGVWDIYVFARSPGTGQFTLATPVRVTR
jgi:glucose/arabinose dehydrogenase